MQALTAQNGSGPSAEQGLCKSFFISSGKDGTLVAGRNDLTLFRIFLSGADGRNERTDTDTSSTKVVYLINLQTGINLAGVSQDITDLIGGNSIQSTAERV